LGSLAEIGYDAVWQDIRASDVGAPHRRERIWIIAYPANRNTDRVREREDMANAEGGKSGQPPERERREGVSGRSEEKPLAYPEGAERECSLHSRGRRLGLADGGETLAYAGDNRTVERERELRGDKPPLCEGQNHGGGAPQYAKRKRRGFESRLGGTFNGLPEGVDRYTEINVWKDGWEDGTPRLSKDRKYRRSRLRVVGNSIIPQIAELIFRSMMTEETI
jgi:site-specific DNA-cytosine methylase